MSKDLNKIVAEQRESFGKGAARKIRAVGMVPAVIYGHGTKPQHITLPAHQLGLILRKANSVLDLDINGKSQLALVKDVQRDPVLRIIEHIDLVVLRKGEKVQVEVNVHVVGEAAPGTALEQEAHVLLIEASAISIPERLEVNVDGLEAVSHVYASQIELPEGVSLIADPETLVVSVVVPTVSQTEVDEADAAAAAEQAPAAS